MKNNHFKIAWRNLIKSKGYSLINIGGLAVGMSVAMLIGLWVYDELNFDKYHSNYPQIAPGMQRTTFNGKLSSQTANPALMGPEIRAKYGSDFKYVLQASWVGSHLVSYNNKLFNNISINIEPGAPEMLSLHMLQG